MQKKKEKLLNPLNDLVFKALFGREERESKLILKDFLNLLLDRRGEAVITEITHLNPFNLKAFVGDKGSIFDLKVKTQQDERINVEIQVNPVDDFRKRSLYYWSKLYAGTIQESENYLALKKSIVINIMDFSIIKETKRHHTIYQIFETKEQFRLIDDLEIHYLELNKAEGKKRVEEMQGIELWLSFLKNAGNTDKREEIEQLIQKREELRIAMSMLEKVSADELLREQYEAREKARLDRISSLHYAEVKGMEKGIEKGRAEGKEEGKKEGKVEGKAEGKAETLIILLSKKLKNLPAHLEETIRQASPETLDRLTEQLFEINSIEELKAIFSQESQEN